MQVPEQYIHAEWLQHSLWWSDVDLRHAPVVLTPQMGGHSDRLCAGLWIHSAGK